MSERTCSIPECGGPFYARGWCKFHYRRWSDGWTDGLSRSTFVRPTVEERFWSKVDRSGDPEACWSWTASLDHDGYGMFALDTSKPGGHQGPPAKAHRVAYEWLVGPIPDGLVIDHLCRNTRCVNPAHLEPVTDAENSRRSWIGREPATYCQRGHPFDEANTYRPPSGQRICRICARGAHRPRAEYLKSVRRVAS